MVYYYNSDDIGSSSFLSNENGLPYQFLLYLPFGETMAEQRTGGFGNRYKFNGKEQDAISGLYYYGARYYDPRIIIWYGVDPLASDYPSWSPFAYTMNNPITYVDPTGMSTEGGGGDPPIVVITAPKPPKYELRPYTPKVKPSEKILFNPVLKFAVQIFEESVEGVNYVTRAAFYGRREGIPNFFEDGHTTKCSNESQAMAIDGMLTVAFETGKTKYLLEMPLRRVRNFSTELNTQIKF